MKNLKTTLSLMALISLIVLTAFKPKNPDYHKLPSPLKDQFAFVTAGKFYIDNDTVNGTAFYMSTTEVTNAQYSNFLTYMADKAEAAELAKLQIDTAVWNDFMAGENKVMTDYYHQHPAYYNYPVVGISLQGAKAYCAYLNEMLNQDPKSKFTYHVQLPTRAQWIQAASIANLNAVYAWNGPYLRNKKGEYLCNFYHVNAENIHRNEDGELTYEWYDNNSLYTVDKSQMDITAPVTAYWPSSAGLYNMNGNAAELTIDGLVCGGSWNDPGYDVRNESFIKYTEPSNTIGFRPMMTVTLKEDNNHE